MPTPDDVRVQWMKAKTLLALEVREDDWEGLLNEQYADKPKVARRPAPDPHTHRARSLTRARSLARSPVRAQAERFLAEYDGSQYTLERWLSDATPAGTALFFFTPDPDAPTSASAANEGGGDAAAAAGGATALRRRRRRG